ncbi:cbb3-type cytochrome oxidase assembly protein CcoS [Balneola sp. MJW-20]|uniref:cbb3-type cytochrome oxidase assembly protein CcoS n=1 Tax=Gracilimonas aurantiaca TaxID=3234185 RepID=UPI0034669335
MEVIFLLIGFSLVVALIFLGLFFWAVRTGQFDDSYTPSVRMLFDEKRTSKTNQSNKNQDA